MQVRRGRREDPAADRKRTQALVVRTRETGEVGVRVWSPPRQVAFGPRDANASGYDRARAAAADRGFPPIERDGGGRAVAYAGTTVAFAVAVPTADRVAIEDRYDVATDAVAAALSTLGVDAERGEPPDSFCPGSHSLQAGGKLAGLAQRVRRDVALVGGIVVPREREELVEVLVPVYRALSLPFDPESVGSVRAAGGDGDPQTVRDALATAIESRASRLERV